MNKMPVLFVGHGSPMNINSDNGFTVSLRNLSGELPKPEAVCVVSAHWQTRGTFVACQESIRQIYDFYGFPEQLYKVRYEPPGCPEVARRAVDLMRRLDPFVQCNDQWGHDHAGWSVLKHLYPDADVPVFLISIDMSAPPERHVQLARKLTPLRDEGVLILGKREYSPQHRGRGFQ